MNLELGEIYKLEGTDLSIELDVIEYGGDVDILTMNRVETRVEGKLCPSPRSENGVTYTDLIKENKALREKQVVSLKRDLKSAREVYAIESYAKLTAREECANLRKELEKVKKSGGRTDEVVDWITSIENENTKKADTIDQLEMRGSLLRSGLKEALEQLGRIRGLANNRLTTIETLDKEIVKLKEELYNLSSKRGFSSYVNQSLREQVGRLLDQQSEIRGIIEESTEDD